MKIREELLSIFNKNIESMEKELFENTLLHEEEDVVSIIDNIKKLVV